MDEEPCRRRVTVFFAETERDDLDLAFEQACDEGCVGQPGPVVFLPDHVGEELGLRAGRLRKSLGQDVQHHGLGDRRRAGTLRAHGREEAPAFREGRERNEIEPPRAGVGLRHAPQLGPIFRRDARREIAITRTCVERSKRC